MALTDGLVAWWDLDDETDAHGDYDLTNENSVAFVSGLKGDAAQFAAASGTRLTLAEADAADFITEGSHTIAFWINTARPVDRETVLASGTYGGVKRFVFWTQRVEGGSNPEQRANIGMRADDTPALSALYIVDHWTCVVLRYDESEGTMTLDVRPVAGPDAGQWHTASEASDGMRVGANTGFAIGDSSIGSDLGLTDGLIDTVVIAHRAWSDQERDDFFNGGAGIEYADIAGAPDETAPTLQSATISQDGLSLTLVFDEAVVVGAGGNTGFALDASGGAASLTYSSGAGTNTLVYTIGRAIEYDETVTLDYTQPGDGIEDATEGNDLASFSDEEVANGSTEGAPNISIQGTLEVHGVGTATSGTMYAANISTDEIETTSVGGDGSWAFTDLASGTYRVWGEVDVSGDTYTTQARIVEVA